MSVVEYQLRRIGVLTSHFFQLSGLVFRKFKGISAYKSPMRIKLIETLLKNQHIFHLEKVKNI